jgi:hypothetical protein
VSKGIALIEWLKGIKWVVLESSEKKKKTSSKKTNVIYLMTIQEMSDNLERTREREEKKNE